MNKKRILIAISAIVLVFLVGGGIVMGMRIYPIMHTARYISNKLSKDAIVFNLDINLDTAGFTEEQNAFAETLTRILDAEPEHISKVHIEGTYDQECLYAEVYFAGLEEPLTEIYTNEEETFINVEMFYMKLREHLIGNLAILEILAPKWQDGSYMTLSQAEQIFGFDVSDIKNTITSINQGKEKISKYGKFITGMGYEKLENGNTKLKGTSDYGDYSVEIDEVNDLISIELEDFNTQKKTIIKSCTADIAFKNAVNIIMPESIVSNQSVELMQGIWKLISGMISDLTEPGEPLILKI